MQEYTQEQYQQDYKENLDSLTPSEEADRKQLGGVFVGLLHSSEWRQRDIAMRQKYGTGMSDGSYETYLQRCRSNTENVRLSKADKQRHLQRFFSAERLSIPHHGQTDETL